MPLLPRKRGHRSRQPVAQSGPDPDRPVWWWGDAMLHAFSTPALRAPAAPRRRVVQRGAPWCMPAAAAPKPLRASSRAARCSSLGVGAAAVVAVPPSSDAVSGGKPFVAWESKLANTFRRTDIKRIMILGAGPIVIGQARPASGGRLRCPKCIYKSGKPVRA